MPPGAEAPPPMVPRDPRGAILPPHDTVVSDRARGHLTRRRGVAPDERSGAGAPLARSLPADGRPTVRDVARVAGVSFKTVSRVVNGEPGVRPETADRVLAAARQLGFRRNEIASSLKRGMSRDTIGLLIEDVSNPFFATVARAVELVTRERGMLVIIASSDEDRSRERRVIDSLVSRRVSGLIVVPIGNDHRYLAREMRLGMAVVFVDRPPGHLRADTVLADNAGGARAGVAHLVAAGHRRIGILTDDLEVYTMAQRFDGYRAALADAAIPFDPLLARHDCHDIHDARSATLSLLDGEDPPTAIFGTNNRMSVGAVSAITASGRGVALVGYDDFELAASLVPPVTVVRTDHEAMGRLSAELLLRRMDGWGGGPERIVLPTEVVPRGSGELAP
jgi:LacI family transcriptional regulator